VAAVSGRDLPPWMYRFPNADDTRIPDLQAEVAELEAALLDTNNIAAQYADLVKLLTLQVEMLLEMETT
jgi:hypothetical protein